MALEPVPQPEAPNAWVVRNQMFKECEAKLHEVFTLLEAANRILDDAALCVDPFRDNSEHAVACEMMSRTVRNALYGHRGVINRMLNTTQEVALSSAVDGYRI